MRVATTEYTDPRRDSNVEERGKRRKRADPSASPYDNTDREVSERDSELGLSSELGVSRERKQKEKRANGVERIKRVKRARVILARSEERRR